MIYGWGTSLGEEKDKEVLRLMRISISVFQAQRMVENNWTVEKVANSSTVELGKLTGYPEISNIWRGNAIKFLEVEGR